MSNDKKTDDVKVDIDQRPPFDVGAIKHLRRRAAVERSFAAASVDLFKQMGR